MKPSVLPLAGDDLLQFSYDLPHRINTARSYPLTAPNGSTVIVYGHENGLCAGWRVATQSHEEQEETEPFFASVIHTFDISLGGAEALHIAFPQLPANMHHDTKSVPKLLSEKLVIAVACSDCSIRVVSLPLTPPESQDAADQVLVLSGNPSHQSLPNCVSVTFTPRPPVEDGYIEIDGADNTSKRTTSRPASRNSRRSSFQTEVKWDLLVASHSPDLSGRLIIHRIPCNKSSLDDSGVSGVPWSLHCLASPAVSLNFSSALYPSSCHSRLLVTEAQGVVRLMECIPKVAGGPWLTSLYTDFETPSDTALPKRKPILDARWLLGGRAILVLLSDGEWGVWDVESAGPRPTEAAPQARKSTNPSEFAIDGWVHTKVGKLATSLENSKATTSKLAPMTPNTRRTRQAALFAPEPQQQQAPSRGGISIVPAPSNSSSRADDETVLLWHGTNTITIPSFFTHWQNRTRGFGNLFGAGAKGEIKTMNNVEFGGEACNEVSLNPCSTQSEIVVAAQRRLIIVAPSHTRKRRPSVAPLLEPISDSTHEQLLAAGELDVLGVDRVLDTMSNGHSTGDITIARKFKTSKTQ